MKSTTKTNLLSFSAWTRGLFMVLYAIIASVTRLVIGLIALFQFLLLLLTGETNSGLRQLGLSLSCYVYQIGLFLTFNSEKMPFPMSAWPSEPVSVDVEDKPL